MTDNTMRTAALKATLRNLIDTQSEGEWDAVLIEKDVEIFTDALLPLFDAVLAQSNLDAERYRFLRPASFVRQLNVVDGDLMPLNGDDLDNAIDAIRTEIGKEET